MNKSDLRNLPGVDKILKHPEIKQYVEKYGHGPVVYTIRQLIKNTRLKYLENSAESALPTANQIVRLVIKQIKILTEPSLKNVINATGIVLHTNLGRAPLGKKILKDMYLNGCRYSNLEFDLTTGRRGNRNIHNSTILQFLTGAEDTLVVNNNAAAIILVLSTLAKGKEVIISRGELIEIGGAFRLPEIMSTSGARMVEVGTTNRTRLSDYENKINSETAILFKAHKSNFAMSGFTEEVSIESLANCAKKYGIPMLYDLGSGLLVKPKNMLIKKEPTVQKAIEAGVDIVTFSCDKLLGGPQAGIIAGKKNMITKCAKSPMMRAFRVGKLTVSALSSVCRHYLSQENLDNSIPLFSILEQPITTIENKAFKLCEKINQLNKINDISIEVIPSKTQIGGGSLPELCVESKAVTIFLNSKSLMEKGKFSEDLYRYLISADTPIIAFLKEGRIILDCSTIFDDEINYCSHTISTYLSNLKLSLL
jgi:L-seryl-tRNA(Ser) seleniumtransferase